MPLSGGFPSPRCLAMYCGPGQMDPRWLVSSRGPVCCMPRSHPPIEVSISSLFGRYCSGKTFAHDILLEQFRPTASDEESQQALRSSQPVESELSFVEETRLQENFAGSKRTFDEYTSQNADRADDHEPRTPTRDDKGAGEEQGGESQQTEASFTSTLSVRHSDVRHEAYHRILNGADHEDWPGISLLSTNDNHSTVEKEL